MQAIKSSSDQTLTYMPFRAEDYHEVFSSLCITECCTDGWGNKIAAQIRSAATLFFTRTA